LYESIKQIVGGTELMIEDALVPLVTERSKALFEDLAKNPDNETIAGALTDSLLDVGATDGQAACLTSMARLTGRMRSYSEVYDPKSTSRVAAFADGHKYEITVDAGR